MPITLKIERKKTILLTTLIIVIGLVGVVYGMSSVLTTNRAAIFIESTPQAVVYINSEQKGKTPYEAEAPVGEVTLELVPDSFDTPLSPYKANIKLVSGVKTIVRRNFGGVSGGSWGEIISFEKI